MKNENAMFLLAAIGEISEQTVNEAKTPVRRRHILRYSAVAGALAAAIAIAVLIGSGGSGTGELTAPSTAESTERLSVDDAISAAQNSLNENGVEAIADGAELITDGKRVYYKVRLLSNGSKYECSVDAESGKVFRIAHYEPETEATDEPTEEETDAPAVYVQPEPDGAGTGGDAFSDEDWFQQKLWEDAIEKSESIGEKYREAREAKEAAGGSSSDNFGLSPGSGSQRGWEIVNEPIVWDPNMP